MAGTIGIKIANGDFYPIMEGNSTVKKRLVLTTVHDSQESVQIDLFRSASKSMLDAQYIGSLLVENIRPRLKGEPSIEMIISPGKDGNVTATARDIDAGPGGEHQILNVSLKRVDSSDQRHDFSIENQSRASTVYTRTETIKSVKKEEKRKFPWLIMVFAALFVIIVIALLWFFFLGGIDRFPGIRDKLVSGDSASPVFQEPQPIELPPPPPPPPPPVQEVPPLEPIAEELPPVVSEAPLIIEAPTTPPPAQTQTRVRTRPPAPVSSYNVPDVIPRNGVPYTLRWGDTLWEISEAFYRNPWLYPRIARYNNIVNPDHIISGRTIRVPPLD